jgi:hypothetical protein
MHKFKCVFSPGTLWKKFITVNPMLYPLVLSGGDVVILNTTLERIAPGVLGLLDRDSTFFEQLFKLMPTKRAVGYDLHTVLVVNMFHLGFL